MQNVFGAGIIWGSATSDASGNAIANPTPVQIGVCQEIMIDISFDTKQLYGQLQLPVAIGRGKGKIGLKIKAAQVNGLLFNSLLFGQTLTTGTLSDVYDVTGVTVATTITPTVPSSGTWTVDLGVRDANGVPYTRVASAPATGQYSVAAGVYTFAAADVGKQVFISYQYTATSTVAKKSNLINLPMGYAPAFRADVLMPFNGKSMIFTFPNCIANKLSMASKLDDFMIPEIDADVFADNAGNIGSYGLSE